MFTANCFERCWVNGVSVSRMMEQFSGSEWVTIVLRKLLSYRYTFALFRCFLFLVVLSGPAIVAVQADQLSSDSLEPIRFQLRWHHQFQFSGYYAAKEKGFYEEAGFDVTLVAGSPDRQPVTEVLAGRAQFAEGNSEVLYARLRGEPLVALASIFQHSPSVLIALASSGIDSPKDLMGKRVMSVGGEGDASFLAMFHREGVDVSTIDLVDSSYLIQDLVDGKTDAFNAYLTNELFYLEEQGVLYNVISPRDYSIDFYSDILFTREDTAIESPERVERFRQATLRGWKYALAYPEEMIQIIRDRYNDEKSTNHMRFEALSVHGLIMPDLVEIGYINPVRIQLMANTFLDNGMVDNLDHLSGFIFVDAEERPNGMRTPIVIVVVFFVALILVTMVLALFNHRLQNEIRERKLVEEKLGKLADTDPLTNLLNRRGFLKHYAEELVRAQRYSDVFSIILIDLDLFKKVNDRYGHEAGDRVLVSVADLLREDTRESDFCGRFGGEEFILLLPNTSLTEATAYAQRLCQHIGDNEVQLRNDDSVNITASAGVAEWLLDDRGEATILRADKALYRAKHNGRNQVAAWDFNLDGDGFIG